MNKYVGINCTGINMGLSIPSRSSRLAGRLWFLNSEPHNRAQRGALAALYSARQRATRAGKAAETARKR